MSEKPDSDAASFPGEVPWPSSLEQNATARQQGRSRDSQQKNPMNDLAMTRDKEAGDTPPAISRGGLRHEEGDGNVVLPPTRPNQAADRAQTNAQMVGAYRVPGIGGSTEDEPEDLEAGNDSDSRAASLLPTIVAENVPELVTATAIPEKLGDSDELSRQAFFCCGFKCGSIAKDDPDNRSRRGLFLCLAAVLVIVAVVVGVSVAVSLRKQDKGGTSSSLGSLPTSPPSSLPTSPPSLLPTSSPTLLATETLFTTFEHTHSYHGHMFDITAKKDIDIISMSIHMKSTDPENVEVWAKEGQYHGFETEEFRWAKKGEATVTGLGENKLTPLPRDLFDPVRVTANDTQSFYVTVQTESIYFQERKDGNVSIIDYGDATEFGNSDLVINVGTGVQYLFRLNGPPNVFNGALDYALA